MSRIKEFYIKYLSWINAYWLVTIVFLIVTFTVGDSSLDKEGLERFAREEYFMKRSNEDVFIIKDK